MPPAKLDSLLQQVSAADQKKILAWLEDPQMTHTEIASMLSTFGLLIHPGNIGRWRAAHSGDQPLEIKVPRILIWDIESSPILGYTWGLFEQNVLSVVQDWKLITVSWTWYGSGEYHVKQLCDFKGYTKGDMDDKQLTLFAHSLLNEADYAVAHNGNAFDIKKVNAKFAEHRIPPPSPYTPIDTLTVARRNMKMSSNRLDSLGQTLGVGRKVKHSGFDLWIRCMAGETAGWKEMKEYARQDVILLEQIFDRLLPWIKGLNYGHYNRGFVCTNCGSPELTQEGQFKTQLAVAPAWHCGSCGTWNKHKLRR